MTRQDILEVLQNKILEIKNTVVALTEEDFIDFRGAGLNSIELMTIIVYLEEHFDFESEDEELNLERFTYVKDIINLVEHYSI